ncbi:hypothetical protein C8R46DRAFT_1220413 [Mycena filopes]|nr:hypothetical protein C8R46DRAFT_1220413 [Mycena filopes]
MDTTQQAHIQAPSSQDPGLDAPFGSGQPDSRPSEVIGEPALPQADISSPSQDFFSPANQFQGLQANFNEKVEQVQQAKAEIRVLRAKLANLASLYKDVTQEPHVERPIIYTFTRRLSLYPYLNAVGNIQGHWQYVPSIPLLASSCEKSSHEKKVSRPGGDWRQQLSILDDYVLKQTLLHEYDWTKRAFETVQFHVKRLAKKKLDPRKSYEDQDPRKVKNLCMKIATRFDLDRYEDFWPIRWMLHAHLHKETNTQMGNSTTSQGSDATGIDFV